MMRRLRNMFWLTIRFTVGLPVAVLLWCVSLFGVIRPIDRLSYRIYCWVLPEEARQTMVIVIEYEKGAKKVFHTMRGPLKLTFPVDYGYMRGTLNPDDGEPADVFIGNGHMCGGFIKNKPSDGNGWVFDERKWFLFLTNEEYTALWHWWHNEHDAGVTTDWYQQAFEDLVIPQA